MTDRKADLIAATLRDLTQIWADFETKLATVPLIDKLNRGRLRREDYQRLLVNLRQQVIEGGRWISRAASGFDSDHTELRSQFIRHAAAEHRDFQMLEQDYVATGGRLKDIQSAEKNIGSEALSAWMFHSASRPNPKALLGAMFIIEGLGQRLASPWADAIREQLGLEENAVRFLAYHGANDEDHMDEFYEALTLAIDNEADKDALVKTAKVTARLYRLQLEEIDNV